MTTVLNTTELNDILTNKSFHIIHYAPDNIRAANENDAVVEGLQRKQKTVPSKYFYDEAGSKLFDRICELPEYYPTRTELGILKKHADEILNLANFGYLVELGSGSEQKINILLQGLNATEMDKLSYVAVDISATAIEKAHQKLSLNFPRLHVLGIVNDFTHELALPYTSSPRLICFLGGTIGNFDDEEAVRFLKNVRQSMNPADRFMLGFDLIKDVSVLEAAYNDREGVTAAFNKNILNVLNRKFGANFNPGLFRHKAIYNADKRRIEMHLEALCEMQVSMAKLNLTLALKKGETIQTEISRKFTLEQMSEMAKKAGLHTETYYTDANNRFAEMIFRV
jgi:dimethylhistidine N-methyltransferase